MSARIKRPEIFAPLLLLLAGIAYMVFCSYIIHLNSRLSRLVISSHDYRDMLFLLFVVSTVHFLLKKQRQNAQQYQTLFDGSPVPMWIFDRVTLRFLNVNPAAIKHYGYSFQQFRQMTIKDIRPAREQNRLEEHIHTKQYNHENKENWTHIKNGGDEIIVTVTASNVYFKGRRCRLAVINDITEMLQAYENKQKAEAEAMEKALVVEKQNQKLREIAFKASHVMRAPLTNVLGLLNLIGDENLPVDEKEKLLPQLKLAGEQLDLVIREVVAETFNSSDAAMTWRNTHKTIMTEEAAVQGN